ncbi:MAG TPA: ATP-binding protein [Polyangia bacterium]
MSDEHASPLLILCPAGARFDCLRELAERRFPGVENPVLLLPLEGDAEAAVRREREERGGVPMGVVVADESKALGVLEAGADETLAETALEAPAVFGFLDRVALRGRLRHEQERLRASYVHAEKLTALGTLVAGVAHEINNPLTALLLSVEALRVRLNPLQGTLQQLDELLQGPDVASREALTQLVRGGRAGASAAEARELLQEIEAAGQNIAEIVQDLKVFSRQNDDLAPEVIDVPALLDQVLRMVGRQIRAAGSLEIDHEPNLPLVVAPSSRLAQVLTNILLNAAQAITETVRPAHRVRVSTRSDDEAVAICVTDSGPGIPADVIGRIFDPFFTTKRPGVGTGLGLSISRSILRRLGGDLLVESIHGDGTTFIALIPRPSRRALNDAKARDPGGPAPAPARHVNRRVLLVDADDRVLRAFARAVDKQHDLLLARDAEEAINLLSSGSRPDVVVADVSPPEAPGIALYRWLVRERPALARSVVFTTPEESTRPSLAAETGLPVLRKPVSRDTLLAAIAGVLGTGTASR